MGERCPRCRKPCLSTRARVQVFGNTWIERVAAVYCPDCKTARLTEAGSEKVNRGLIVMREMLKPANKEWVPIVEFTDREGNLCQKELTPIKG